jgi:hypothetical protein
MPEKYFLLAVFSWAVKECGGVAVHTSVCHIRCLFLNLNQPHGCFSLFLLAWVPLGVYSGLCLVCRLQGLVCLKQHCRDAYSRHAPLHWSVTQ